jgi:glycerol-3-phosphate dehydrogenase
VRARALVNAAGPWVAQVLGQVVDIRRVQPMRLVKGSHFVVARLFEGDFAFVFQNDDGRICFAIPFEQAYTLIGTTEVDFAGDPSDAVMDRGEMDYLRAALGRYLKHPPEPGEALWSFSGVRPLIDDDSEDASAISRDYVLELDGTDDQAPLLSIFGGKITTYRRLAEQAMDKLRPALGFSARPWTAGEPLPGGDLGGADLDGFTHAVIARYPLVPPDVIRRFARTYGSRVHLLLDGRGDLGGEIAAGLFEAEVEYLLAHEWAGSAEDILWRRTKLGLELGGEGAARLNDWLAGNRSVPDNR